MPATVWFGSGEKIADSIKYKYDSCGNICEIRENGHIVAKYAYDSLNRIVREDNRYSGTTFLFTYDQNGNITERCEYPYTLKSGEELEELKCTHYSYDYEGDKLKEYNGEAFVYNNLGCPTTYRGKPATWIYGKLLASYNGVQFTYNGLGSRASKGGITFTYDSDGRLIKQSNGLEFIYDNAGVVGVKYGGKQYLYRKDAQGNIVAILTDSGAVEAKYVYDAWGNNIALNANGAEITSGIGALNPFRYRGYYYDTETELYYLQTRYYDPELGRFISQDGLEYADPETINGLNLYAYCSNNPVMNVDPTGEAPKWYEWFLSTVLLIGGAILCFVPGAQGIGATLLVSGVSMTASNIMSAAGVNGKTASLISSGIDIIAGIALCFTPFAGLGASFIGSGVGGIAGGYIAEGLGGRFETGAAIGSIIGSIVGGRIYEGIKVRQLARAGTVVIGEGMNRVVKTANNIGAAYYKGMPGFAKLSTYLPKSVMNQLGLAHNASWIRWVAKAGVNIVDLGVIGNNSKNYLMEILYIMKWLF